MRRSTASTPTNVIRRINSPTPIGRSTAPESPLPKVFFLIQLDIFKIKKIRVRFLTSIFTHKGLPQVIRRKEDCDAELEKK